MRPSERLESEVDMRNVDSMERRGFLKQSLSAVALGVAGRCTRGERSTGPAEAADPAHLHRDAIVIDTYGKLYLEDFHKGQVDAIVHEIGTPSVLLVLPLSANYLYAALLGTVVAECKRSRFAVSESWRTSFGRRNVGSPHDGLPWSRPWREQHCSRVGTECPRPPDLFGSRLPSPCSGPKKGP